MKHLLIILISLLFLSSLKSNLFSQETGVLFRYESSSDFVWKRIGNEKIQPTYQGEIENGNPHGFGFVTYPFEDKNILGEWKKGKEWNTKHTKNNGTLIGKFENGEWELIFGELYIGERDSKFGYFPDKWEGVEDGENRDIGKYEGIIKFGLPNGQGTFILNNGEKYLGQFKDGKSHGQGTYTFKKGNKYIGSWKDGKRDGEGSITWSDGSNYEGGWKNGKYNGEGILKLTTGERYVGGFKNSKKDGYGTFTLPSGDKYVGEWKNGEKSGEGTFTFEDGDEYVGEWLNGEKNGHGTYTWSVGDKYVGEYKDNKRWNGIYYNKNGTKIGKFLNGKEIK